MNELKGKVLPRITGLAPDILNEAQHSRYDALLVGRRGLSKAQELFLGSVSNQLVQHAVNVPLWIIDGRGDRAQDHGRGGRFRGQPARRGSGCLHVR